MSETSFNEVAQRMTERATELRGTTGKNFLKLLESLLDLLKSIVFSYFFYNAIFHG